MMGIYTFIYLLSGKGSQSCLERGRVLGSYWHIPTHFDLDICASKQQKYKPGADQPVYSQTLYNVTHYNRIFNIRHRIAGKGSVSIKIPSL